MYHLHIFFFSIMCGDSLFILLSERIDIIWKPLNDWLSY